MGYGYGLGLGVLRGRTMHLAAGAGGPDRAPARGAGGLGLAGVTPMLRIYPNYCVVAGL